MATTARQQRVADEIRKTVTTVLARYVNDPRLQWVSITDVVVSPDLGYARIYYSSLAETVGVAEIDQAFVRAAGLFKKQLSRAIRLRVTPELRFCYDDSLVYGKKMDNLIDQARDADAAVVDSRAQTDEQAEQEADHEKQAQDFNDGRKRLR